MPIFGKDKPENAVWDTLFVMKGCFFLSLVLQYHRRATFEEALFDAKKKYEVNNE